MIVTVGAVEKLKCLCGDTTAECRHCGHRWATGCGPMRGKLVQCPSCGCPSRLDFGDDRKLVTVAVG